MQDTKLKRRDRSTISKSEYLINHALYSILLACDLYVILPIIVPIAKYNNSISRLLLCMFVANFLGILLDFKYNRCDGVLARDVTIGIASYLLLTLGMYAPAFAKWLLGGTVVLSALGIMLIVVRKIDKKKDIILVIRIKLLQSIRLLQRNAGVAAIIVVMVLPVMVRWFPNSNKVAEESQKFQKKSELSVSRAYGDEYRLLENIETIKLIRDNAAFQELDFDKKCEVLKACIYCEARYLGLCEINIEFNDDMEENVRGSYNHATKTISINAGFIRDGGTAYELLHTCLHECRHCYQHLLVDLYREIEPSQRNLLAFTEDGVGEWVKNMANYQQNDGTTTGEIAYQMQAIELDAENYALENVLSFYLTIDDVLKEQSQDE